jgi:ABC-2 type transport system ATP-binding protein
VLDEPATGLDPAGVLWLRMLLRGLADQGRTVLVSSHLLAEMAQTVDDVIVINGGRLIAHGPISDLIGSTRSTSLEELFFALVSKGTSP